MWNALWFFYLSDGTVSFGGTVAATCASVTGDASGQWQPVTPQAGAGGRGYIALRDRPRRPVTAPQPAPVQATHGTIAAALEAVTWDASGVVRPRPVAGQVAATTSPVQVSALTAWSDVTADEFEEVLELIA